MYNYLPMQHEISGTALFNNEEKALVRRSMHGTSSPTPYYPESLAVIQINGRCRFESSVDRPANYLAVENNKSSISLYSA